MYRAENNNMMPPPIAQKSSFKANMGRRIMSGMTANITTLPNWFATYAVGTYAVALLGVSVMYSSYAMEWYFWLFGIGWVAGFFFLSVKFSQEWSIFRIHRAKAFEKKLLTTGFVIRAIYVVFIYYFYLNMTGKPHEFATADSEGYIEMASDLGVYLENGRLWTMFMEFAKTQLSDLGYPMAIMLPVKWFGEEGAVLPILIANSFIGAITSVLVYRTARREMSETTARLAAIFCMLHPVLICYAGMTLKEVLMAFLVVLFIDLADRMMRERRYSISAIAPMVLVGMSLFLFRTVLGMIAFMALFFALVMTDSRIVSMGKKISLGVLIFGILALGVSEDIKNEIQQVTNTDVRAEQETSMKLRYGSEKGGGGGNAFAKYAGAAVFAPLIFTIPFPTIVSIEGQEDMRLIHGGNWMRNVMSGFVILAMFMLLLSGDWRKYTLPLAMMLGYLLMLAFTQFAHSLRFHIPVMAFEMIFAAYAITNLRKKHRVWYMVWSMFMVVACFAWNWFKMAGRGL